MSLSDVIHRSKGNQGRRTIVASEDFVRITNLPRRDAYEDYSALITAACGTKDGTMGVWPIQAIALMEAAEQGGCFGSIAAGSGKSLITLLLPIICQLKAPLLIVPASLKHKAIHEDIPHYRKHFQMHPHLSIISYSELSTVNQADVLERKMPDGIICDEVHYLANHKSARTRRFLRYFKNYPATQLYAFSGTITKKSLREYAHLVRLALKENAPVPTGWHELQDWADLLDADNPDPDNGRINPGAMVAWKEHPTEPVRLAFRRRFVETPGIITTEEGAIGNTLIIKERPIKHIPTEVLQTFTRMRTLWQRPDGDEIHDALTRYRVGKELASGFYYRWAWPNGIVDREYMDARKAWRKFVRETIEYSPKHAPIDSEKQVWLLCHKGKMHSEEFLAWEEVRQRPEPPSEAIWISEFLIDQIEEWCNKNKGIVWIDHDAVAMKCKERGLPTYVAGDDTITQERNACVASYRAHGTGKNLQHFHKNLFACSPANGTAWEQTLARTHRPGQQSDEVYAEVFLHTRELWSCFQQARRGAKYVEESTGQKQKLMYANIEVTSEHEAAIKKLSTDPLWMTDKSRADSDTKITGLEEVEDIDTEEE